MSRSATSPTESFFPSRSRRRRILRSALADRGLPFFHHRCLSDGGRPGPSRLVPPPAPGIAVPKAATGLLARRRMFWWARTRPLTEQTPRESTPGTWPLGTASATAAPSRMCELGAWKHAGANLRSGYRLWQLPSDRGPMVHAEPEFGYGLGQGSQGFAKQRRRRASSTPGNRVRAGPKLRSGTPGWAGSTSAAVRAPGDGPAPGRPKIVNCQEKLSYGNCQAGMRRWEGPTTPVSRPDPVTGTARWGRGGRPRRKPVKAVSQHSARLAVRASAASPDQGFSACPEKQHGRW